MDQPQPTIASAAAAGPFAAVVETHSGVVFFVGDKAYKLKKPVRFGFLDFRSREVRESVCRREVELNRRLAPDVYLGVSDLVDEFGQPMDHLVTMRRLPDDRRLGSLLTSGADVDDHVRKLARVLADFHARCETSEEIDVAADSDAMATRWEANAAEMQRFVGTVLDAVTNDHVLAAAARYLAGRRALFAARVAAGMARDGHGDLLADDIFCLDDGPRVLDCIEFDDRLRWGDVLADVAFLAMDMERLGRPEAAENLLRWYGEDAGDRWPLSLAHHHIAYRAQVRAKVACLRWEQGDEASAVSARGLLDLAAAHLDAGRVRLVLVGGLPGTGKSTLASGLAEALGAVVLRSDEIRKELAGLDPTTSAAAPLDQGLYRPRSTSATYVELLDRARVHLAHGCTVVLDATWHDPSLRQAARDLAGDTFADIDELRCSVPLALAEARITARAAAGGATSDATPAVASAMAAVDAPWPTATPVDTTAPPDEVLRRTLDRLKILA